MHDFSSDPRTIAYRRWKSGHIDYSGDVIKKTEIVCIDCHNFESDNDKRDADIVDRSETGHTIKITSPKCAGCGEKIRVF